MASETADFAASTKRITVTVIPRTVVIKKLKSPAKGEDYISACVDKLDMIK